MAYDNLCKYLAETYPAATARWLARRCPELAGATMTDAVQVLKTELPVEPVRADFVTLLRAAERILHVEFHVDPGSEPPLGLRMLDYWVRLYRLYRLPVTQAVVLLRESGAGREMGEVFEVGETRHRFAVVRLWEVEAEELLEDEALLPLAVLGKWESGEGLLRATAERVERVTDAVKRANLSACAQVLAGLRFDRGLIRSLFREGTMRESVIYQEILERGMERGLERGLAEGLERGLAEGLERGLERGLAEGRRREAVGLARALLERRFGVLPSELAVRIEGLTREQAEALVVETIAFEHLDAVRAWLAAQPVAASEAGPADDKNAPPSS